MNKNGILLLTLIIISCLLFGCSQDVSVAPSDPVCMPLISKQDLMQTAQQILVNKQFVIEKYDVSAGYIFTRPMRGSQFFEPWRGDNVGSANRGLSNIHSIERVVTMNFTEQSGQVCVECIADARRLSIPEQQLESNSEMESYFTIGSSSVMGLKPVAEEDIAWIDLGRDGLLERDILQKMKLKATQVK